MFITAGPMIKLFAGGGGGEWRTCAESAHYALFGGRNSPTQTLSSGSSGQRYLSIASVRVLSAYRASAPLMEVRALSFSKEFISMWMY